MGKTVTVLVSKQNEDRIQCTCKYIQMYWPAEIQEKQPANITSLCKQ